VGARGGSASVIVDIGDQMTRQFQREHAALAGLAGDGEIAAEQAGEIA
jgi:hypothetical protein